MTKHMDTWRITRGAPVPLNILCCVLINQYNMKIQTPSMRDRVNTVNNAVVYVPAAQDNALRLERLADAIAEGFWCRIWERKGGERWVVEAGCCCVE